MGVSDLGHSAGRAWLRPVGGVPDLVEGGEVLVVGVGEGVEVLLGGGDLGVSQGLPRVELTPDL